MPKHIIETFREHDGEANPIPGGEWIEVSPEMNQELHEVMTASDAIQITFTLADGSLCKYRYKSLPDHIKTVIDVDHVLSMTQQREVLAGVQSTFTGTTI
jgi:hypothetical protein